MRVLLFLRYRKGGYTGFGTGGNDAGSARSGGKCGGEGAAWVVHEARTRM